MTAARQITAPDTAAWLGQLARAAHETSSSLADCLVSLRNAIDREDPARIFAALEAFETAAGTARDANAAVISEAIDRHGFY